MNPKQLSEWLKELDLAKTLWEMDNPGNGFDVN